VCPKPVTTYCKNLTSVPERDVVGVFRQVLCHEGGVSGRTEPGKSFEIVDEVRLIEVSAVERDLRPVQVTPGVDHLHHLLKPLDAAEQFGGQADFLAEDLYKPA